MLVFSDFLHMHRVYDLFEDWTFTTGSFCLVMHSGLDHVPVQERTRDGYWKVRIVEIRKPKVFKRDTELVCDEYICVWFN